MDRVAISDTALVERQALTDDAFLEHYLELIANFGPREFTQEAFERGMRYPWHRPRRSYLLRDGEAVLVEGLDAGERAAALERHAGRSGLLAFGSNAAPRNLAIKLAHLTEPEDREVLMLAGELHGLDVVAAAAVTIYGAVPATLEASPGTSVTAIVLMVTEAQLTALTWGEIPYRLGRLADAPFTVEDGIEGLELESPLAFVARWGAFLPDGRPAALAAVPGHNRCFREWSQRQLLDRAAALTLGQGDADALVRALCREGGRLAARFLPAMGAHARPFDHPGWRPIEPDGTVPPG